MLFSLNTSAQNSLRDIPSPDVQDQLRSFQVAEGFEVNLFASEPMVLKPIQMNWDEQGRLWVVSSTVYPHLKPGETPNDRVYVLEDTNGDGKADKSTLFAEGLISPTGILPGDGGVYVANSTEILHLKDTNGDGRADVRKRVLTGFGTGDTHHLIHTFRWGPDGLMYFNQSIYIYSHVETPWGVRRLEGGGVWQFNPKTMELNVFARGLINPWGLQFDRWGQSFLTDGAGGEGINFAFPEATFVTAPGAERIIRGLNPGQPKHSGLDIVSGRHLPSSWEGSLITNDFRANRINRFVLEDQGSGFVSKQVEDLLWTDHIGFRPVDILVGPDGAIYVADWYNPIIQHGEVDFHDPRRDQQHGRIWRITVQNSETLPVPNLNSYSVKQLLDALKSPEAWTRTMAKQVLKNRSGVDEALTQWIDNLDKAHSEYEHHLLEGLWVSQIRGITNTNLLTQLLQAKEGNARAAAVRVLSAWNRKVPSYISLLEKAVSDSHPRVRLEAITALGKINEAKSAKLALSVLDHPMDEYLDFALWNSVRMLEPVWMPEFEKNREYLGDSKRTSYALKSVKNPQAINHLTNLYIGDQVPENFQSDVLAAIARHGNIADLNTLFEKTLAESGSKSKTLARLTALRQAATQRKLIPDNQPGRIGTLVEHGDTQISTISLQLAGLWNRTELIMRLVSIIETGDRDIKVAALRTLAMMTDPKGHQLLLEMAERGKSEELRVLATAQLVPVNPTKAADLAVKLMETKPEEREAAELFGAFMAQDDFVAALTARLEKQGIPAEMAKLGRQSMRHISWFRQNNHVSQALRKALEASGGVLPPERMPQQLNESQVYALVQQVKNTADPELGEAIYRKTALACQTCHAIGGAGGLIGPDLSSLGTSSPIDNIIRSIVDPAESIKEGYELQKITKNDGSVAMGYLVADGGTEVVLRNVAGMEERIPKSQISSHENVPGSLMPPGLTASLERKEFIDLIGYLSKLGESGKYRVPTERFVRRWRVASANQELGQRWENDGIDKLLSTDYRLRLGSNYSRVAGDLPLEEIPIIELGDGKKRSLVQFEIEVLTSGDLGLTANLGTGLELWNGSEPVSFIGNTAIVRLVQGKHQLTLAIDRSIHTEGGVAIRLSDPAHNAAQTRLTMGR
ncbi:putative L-sorbosone dehydrogenase [Lunatimonas lonarensis]|uniref:Putative L-sorbosone dehydrogenase n=1 Tax=Lunatimonas lonarensis TaxID=1232681 RepID=R7ZR10_9BACT|nr:PVC-type heme-binding CxxCH protein [Lunatimonas lonarensis]EON76517.1 putative L-sorbosone dehydrogenase [Lunatimonas lonarensis]